VTAFVMGRRWQSPVWGPFSPVGLTLQLHAMATGTADLVDQRALLEHHGVVRSKQPDRL
jgi:hypothetical protein